ncbi:hypothetical protein IOD16_09480 [Saccharothrix sp. 6-C]|uniref:hypothetical protein n=1 Tax=Saccharothrix sp. 6-C TaxID=2781735 RepID=UPI0019177E7A|nr:hypothetical protein [Saccharothrix sp. 6-C]QQQ78653.1 hypothetical protein IOD16_09480 [Saccharothrix sp. 6-C]
MTRRRRLAHVSALARELETALDGKLDRILDRKLAHDLALELRRAIERSRVVDVRLVEVCERVRALESAVEVNFRGTTSFGPLLDRARSIRVGLEEVERTSAEAGPANRLIETAVAVLPAHHRARYGEEFRAELADLPRHRRIPHAIGLVSRSLRLRRALLDARATKSARP